MWGSKATRTTPRPWENSTKGSRNPSKRDLCVERKTSGEPCSRDSQKEVPTIKTQPNPSTYKSQGSTEGGRAPLHTFQRKSSLPITFKTMQSIMAVETEGKKLQDTP